MRLFGFKFPFRRKPRQTLRPPIQWAATALLDGHYDAVRAEFERECG